MPMSRAGCVVYCVAFHLFCCLCCVWYPATNHVFQSLLFSALNPAILSQQCSGLKCAASMTYTNSETGIQDCQPPQKAVQVPFIAAPRQLTAWRETGRISYLLCKLCTVIYLDAMLKRASDLESSSSRPPIWSNILGCCCRLPSPEARGDVYIFAARGACVSSG